MITAAQNGKAADERWHQRKDGSQFWGSGTMNALYHADGTVRGFLKVFRDATVRYEMERHIRALNDDLEKRVQERTAALVAKNEELEGFSYSVAHDMRSPLRAIVSNARIALDEEGPRLSEGGKRNLLRLSQAALRMAHLVDDLLQYARLGTREIRRERTDVGELARRVAEEVASEHPESPLNVRIDCQAEAECDPRLVGMALHNLIDNARKYRRPEVPTEIVVGCEVRNGEQVFSVRDNGIGFDMTYVSKLFVPFERLHREEFDGTGIGLANVKRAIERHGGRVWAEGELGKGATFFFTLP
jgi:light-regulated signal transduction histidine kinase (bacteriophytochrome)